MKIRAAQREAFRARDEETFPHRARAVLVKHVPARRADLEGQPGLAEVRAAIDGARARGFLGERDACRWIALGYLLGEGFADEPWAVAVLTDPRHETPTARIEALWGAAEERELHGGEAELTKAFAPEG